MVELAESDWPGRSSRSHLVFASICLTVLLAAVLRNAWLCDDAFITFRSVDNVLNGYGMVWNVGERVQPFTHPLWFLLLAAASWATGSVMFSAFALGILFTAAAILMVFRHAGFVPSRVALTTAILGLSVCFNSYATSGLENPLSHVLLIWLFVSVATASEDRSAKHVVWPSLAVGLLYLTRPDGPLLVLPLAVWAVFLVWRSQRTWRNAGAVLGWSALGLAPAAVWTLFSLFYFGSPFPNTAYAKLAHGIPSAELHRIGLGYIADPLVNDPVTAAAVIAALVVAGTLRSGVVVASALGILLHLGYLVWIGGDFMAGRHLTGTLVLATLMLAQLRPVPVRKLAPLLVVFGLLAPVAWFGAVEFSQPNLGTLGPTGIVDERRAYSWATSIWKWIEHDPYPLHLGARSGRVLREQAAAAQGSRLVVTRGAVGMAGFFGGPSVHIIDDHGLADPLLARLPARRDWRIGHFRRRLPCGYLETVSGMGELCDPDLAAYYGTLSEVISGELASRHRLGLIWRLNTGQLDHFLESYVDRAGTH